MYVQLSMPEREKGVCMCVQLAVCAKERGARVYTVVVCLPRQLSSVQHLHASVCVSPGGDVSELRQAMQAGRSGSG